MATQELLDSIPTITHTPASNSFRLTSPESQILSFWDRLQETHLEISLLKAQRDAQRSDTNSDIPTLSDEDVQAEIEKEEKALLEARSKYMTRQNLIQHVLITDPVLKAVHSGASVTELETRLLPLIHERDSLGMLQSLLSTQLQDLRRKISRLEEESIAFIASNKALASRMLSMAEDAKMERVEDVKDERLRGQLEDLERQVEAARREWRVLKSVVGGMVVGSGVDWARDAGLLEAVLDEEDELG